MPNLGDFSIGRWSLLSYRFWLVVLGLVLILFGFLFYRAYQVGPLLRPPPAPSSSVSSSAPEGNWPTGRADLGASGSIRENGPAPPWSVVWDFQAPGKILGTPAVVGNRVYVTTEAGIALALDKDTSEVLWTFVIGSPSDSATAVTESAVYIGSRNHRVLAVHRDTGQLLWEHNLGNIVLGSPIVVDGTLYIGSTNGKLVALDAVTGEARWSVGADGWVVGHPAADGQVVAAASLGERFITVDPESGRRLLKFFTGTPVAGGPVIANGLSYFVTNRGGVWAVDPYAVSRPFSRLAYVANVNFFAWRLRDDAPIQVGTVWGGYARCRVAHSPTFANGDLVVVNETGHITSFDGLTGLVRWEHEMERDVITEPVAAGNQIIIATNDRRLFAFNSDTGALAWECDLVNTNLSTAPAIAGGVLYLPTHDGRLLALR